MTDLHCVKCDKSLENIIRSGYQPLNGLAFQTEGHYGSAYFDQMNGTYLEIAICDECVAWLENNGRLYRSAHIVPDLEI